MPDDDFIAEGWAWATIEEITDSVANFKPESQPSREFGYVDISSICNQTYRITDYKRFAGKDAPSRARRPIKPNDVLFSNVRTYLRNIALVPRNLDVHLCSTGFTVLRANDAIDPRLLFYQVLTDRFIHLVTPQQTGSQYPATSDRVVMATSIPLPPLPEQARIVEKIEDCLDRAHRARSHLLRIPPTLKRFREAVLASGCSGQLTEDWRDSHDHLPSGRELLTQILAERQREWSKAQALLMMKKGIGSKEDHWKSKYKTPAPCSVPPTDSALPESWVWTTVLQLSTKVTDGVHKTPKYTSNGVPFISVNNITEDGDIDFSQCKFIREEEHAELYKRCNPEVGDILLGKVGTIGLTAVIRSSAPFSLFVNAALIKPVRGLVVPEYLSMFLTYGFQRNMFANQVGGSAQQFIGTTSIGALPIALPPLEEQREIVRRTSELFQLGNRVAQRVGAAALRTERLTESILAKAFRGELVPTEAELARREGRGYEPASVILERIKAERALADSGKMRPTRRPSREARSKAVSV